MPEEITRSRIADLARETFGWEGPRPGRLDAVTPVTRGLRPCA